MSKPYAQLRARMSEDAQRQACDRARALLAGDTCAYVAYAVWFRHTYPTAPSTPAYSWQLLATYDAGRRVQAMWHDIAQAVLDVHQEDMHHA